MELRTMRYFLTVAREENMTRAAGLLHVTQPTLSKQLKALEEELGKKLFTRHSFSIRLTEEGILLRKRAEDLVRMADKITAEFLTLDDCPGGNVYFGLAESCQIRRLAAVIKKFKSTCPGMRYHITSGDTEQVTEKLDKGVIDFAVLAEEPNTAKYHYLTFPEADVWGVVMPKECPMAAGQAVTAEDLAGLPLFCSEQGWNRDLPKWCGSKMEELHLEGSFRLSYNASLFVKEGLGYLLTFRNLIDTSPESGLVFRPLTPRLETKIYLIWKKHQVFTPVAERLLEAIRSSFAEQGKQKIRLLFGTGNPAKLEAMRRRLSALDLEIAGLQDMDGEAPGVPEEGNTPLENARQKALAYYEAFGIPVFSCDSGLYFEGVPDEIQPGVHVRTVNGKYLTDREMLKYYGGLAKKYGNLKAEYRNAICLVKDREHVYEAMIEEGEPFLLTSVPHSEILHEGFPLDSLSVDIKTGKYFYDLEEEQRDGVAVADEFVEFFRSLGY